MPHKPPKHTAASKRPSDQCRQISAEAHVSWEDWREERKFRLDMFALGVAILTMTAAVVYAGLTSKQLKLMSQQLELTKQEFTKDQRPYVLFDRANRIDAGGQLYLNIGFDNFGKSPALKVVTWGHAFYGPFALQQAAIAFKTLHHNDDGEMNEAPMAPGRWKEDESALHESIRLDSNLLAKYSDVDWNVVVATRAIYSDMAGNSYQSDACYAIQHNGAMGICGVEPNPMN